MSEGELTPEAREYLAGLARGDRRAEQLQQIHEMATEVGGEVLKLAAEHYAACHVADFWRAEHYAAKIQETIGYQLRAHRAVVGKTEKEGEHGQT